MTFNCVFPLKVISHLQVSDHYVYHVITKVPGGNVERITRSRSETKKWKSFFLPEFFQKRKEKHWRESAECIFSSALITGLLSDRSLSKSYKLEGGGWNRDLATLCWSLLLLTSQNHNRKKHTVFYEDIIQEIFLTGKEQKGHTRETTASQSVNSSYNKCQTSTGLISACKWIFFIKQMNTSIGRFLFKSYDSK